MVGLREGAPIAAQASCRRFKRPPAAEGQPSVGDGGGRALRLRDAGGGVGGAVERGEEHVGLRVDESRGLGLREEHALPPDDHRAAQHRRLLVEITGEAPKAHGGEDPPNDSGAEQPAILVRLPAQGLFERLCLVDKHLAVLPDRRDKLRYAEGLRRDHREANAALGELVAVRVDVRGARATKGSSQSASNVQERAALLPK
mmetsp:Transcript_12990/g.22207  ORF Transcript_12990/g.22207 Transcript_12990/m.22207 type:complete len:201 (-) Transcript_12990:192-794(-)